MKRVLTVVTLFRALVLALPVAAPVKAQHMPVIGFMQLLTQAAAEEGRMGAIESLNAAGFVDGKTAKFVFANANGDVKAMATLAQKMVDVHIHRVLVVSDQSQCRGIVTSTDILAAVARAAHAAALEGGKKPRKKSGTRS